MIKLSHRLRWICHGLGAVYVATLTIACLLPPPALPQFSLSDKAIHLGAFFVLMGWYGLIWPHHLGKLVLLCSAFGGVIELLQMLTPNRAGDGWDWLADMLGVWLAAAPLYWLSPKIQRFWKLGYAPA